MPALTVRDLVAQVTGQADRSGGYVMQPKDGVVAIDMDKCKPSNAEGDARKGGSGFGISERGVAYTLTAADRHGVAYAVDADATVAFLPNNSARTRSIGVGENVSPTLIRGNANVACATRCVGTFDMCAGKTGARTDTSGVSPTLLAMHGSDPHAVCISFDAQMGCMNTSPKEECGETLAACHRVGVAVAFEPGVAGREGNPNRFVEEVSPTVCARMGDNRPAVAHSLSLAAKQESMAVGDEVSATLVSTCHKEPDLVCTAGGSRPAIRYTVRRLTPLECERLQGLPDGYTRIPYRGKSADGCPDSPRYKALGNGWAVNCARWICQRIQKYDVNQVKGTVK